MEKSKKILEIKDWSVLRTWKFFIKKYIINKKYN